MMSVMAVVLEQRLERAEAQHVVDDLVDQVGLLRPVELQAVLGQQLADHAFQLTNQLLARQADGGRQVDARHEQRLDRPPRLVDLAARQSAARFVGSVGARGRIELCAAAGALPGR